MSHQENKDCRADWKPYYSVAEAATFWCNISGREVRVDENGIPYDDPQNPCLRSRAQDIMLAIDEGLLRCGRDGRSVAVGEHVARPRRTVLRTDLKKWMTDNWPGSKPAFLFDEFEQRLHSGISRESYESLQASLAAKEKRLEESLEKIRELNQGMTEITLERDALRKQVESSKGMGTRQKRTWLVVMAALCEKAGINPYTLERGTATELAEATQRMGAPVTDDTIRGILAEIPEALEARSS